MNWKQLYASSTPEERLKLLAQMLGAIEERQQKIVFTGRRWVRNRRQGYQAHFLNDRRTGWRNVQRAASLITFGAVLVTVSAATLAITLQAPLHVGGLVSFFYATSLMGVLMFRPNNLKFRSARS